MTGGERHKLGLVVRAAPFAGRSARDDLDVALAAATLEIPLEVFFLGFGLWQTAAERSVEAALLPQGLAGWAALADLTEARFFAEAGLCRRMREAGVGTTVPVEPLDGFAMAERWRSCSRVMVL